MDPRHIVPFIEDSPPTKRSEMRGAEWDHRHFTFVRNTGLPVGTFKRSYHRTLDDWGDVIIVVVCVLLAVCVTAGVFDPWR